MYNILKKGEEFTCSWRASLKENPFQLKAPKKQQIEDCKDANLT